MAANTNTTKKPATAKKATKGKATTKKATKPVAAETTKKDGLRAPQLRILEAMAQVEVPLSRKDIARSANVDLAYCTSWIGSSNEEVRAKNDQKIMSLVSLGLVKFGPKEGNGDTYQITAKGKKEVK